MAFELNTKPLPMLLEKIESLLSECVCMWPYFIKIEMGPTTGNSYNGVYSGRYWFWGTQVLYYGEVKNKTF